MMVIRVERLTRHIAVLADGVAATFANPAGLVQLARPEVSTEARRQGCPTPFAELPFRISRKTGFPGTTR
jgi:hypothetical protein